MKKLTVIPFLFFLFVFTEKVWAVTLSVNNFPQSISSEQFNVDVLVAGPNPGTNYLRIDLYKEGTTNYFGETNNGTNWYGGSDGLQYFPITINQESTGSATLQGRIGNPNLTEYPGPGSYKLRIRRYTSSGNSASGDLQTPADIQITLLIPSPTPDPTSVPTSSPTPTLTPNLTLNITLTPSPYVPKSILTPTKKTTPSPAVASAKEGSPTPEEVSVLAAVVSLTPSPTLIEESAKVTFNFLPLVFIISGLIFLMVSGFLLFSSNRKKGIILK